MILPRGDALLLPANPLFVWLTLVLAFLLNLVPLGRMPAMPDFLAVVLVFWAHQPRRVASAWLSCSAWRWTCTTALLGQHALAYTLRPSSPSRSTGGCCGHGAVAGGAGALFFRRPRCPGGAAGHRRLHVPRAPGLIVLRR